MLRPALLRAVLIANLRTLFCRVPSRGITRSPWATRPAHLCRFTVRNLLDSIANNFLGRVLFRIFLSEERNFHNTWKTLCCKRKSNNTPRILLSVLLELSNKWDGILTVCPSLLSRKYTESNLGPPNPWLIVIAKETLGFRRPDISSGLRLLMPTFSLLWSPPNLAI